MVNQQIVDYVRALTRSGFERNRITIDLTSAGWQKPDIDEAFEKALSPLPSSPVPQPGTPPNSSVVVPAIKAVDTLNTPHTSRFLRSQPTKILVIIAIVLLGGAGSAAAALGYKIVNNPRTILLRSFSKLQSADSASVALALAPQNEENIAVSLDFHKNLTTLSRATVRITNIQNNPNKNVSLEALFTKKDLFAHMNLSFMSEIEQTIQKSYPEAIQLRSYQMLQPIVKGESWLHTKIPESTASATAKSQTKGSFSQKEKDQLQQKILSSIIYTLRDTDYALENEHFYRIALGLKKKELLGVIDYIKTLNLDIQLSELTSLARIINASNEWDKDLIIIFVSKKSGYPTSVSVSIPKIPQDVLQNSVQENIANNANIGFLKGIVSPDRITNFLKGNTSELLRIGTLTLSNFNSAPVGDRPKDTVELATLVSAASDELAPLIGGLMSGQGLSQVNPYEAKIYEAKRLWEKGLYKEALDQATAALPEAKTDKEKAVAHYWIGLSYYHLKDLGASESEQLQSIALDPSFGPPYATLAGIELSKNNPQKAYDYATKSVSLVPDYSWAHNNLGLALLALNKQDLGIAELRKAVSLAPDSFVFQDNLNRALKNSGQSTQAIPPSATTSPGSDQTKFQSSGQKTVEDGITAKINSATENGNSISIKITFANIGNGTKRVYPIRLQLRSKTHGGGDPKAYLTLDLDTGEMRSLDYSMEKIPNPPYTFKYTSSSGDEIDLGTYTP